MEKFWTQHYPEGVETEVDSSAYSSLTHLFDDMFARYANREFSSNMGVTYTYGQIDAMSRCISAWLQSQGLKKGDKVALMMPNVNQYMPIVLGIIRGGYVVTSINPMYTARELKHQLDDTQASILFILEPFCQVLEKIVNETQLKTVVVSKIGDMLGTAKGTIVNLMAKHVKKAVPAHNLKSSSKYTLTDFKSVVAKGKSLPYSRPIQTLEDLAFVQYTGGTTGVAKGVLLSHRNLISGTLTFNAWLSPSFANVKEGETINSGDGSELSATVCAPGGRGELQAAVVAIAGVDLPVAAGLTLCEAVPIRIRSCGGGGGHGSGGGANDHGSGGDLCGSGRGLAGVTSHKSLSFLSVCAPSLSLAKPVRRCVASGITISIDTLPRTR